MLRVAVLVDHRPNHPGETGGLAGTWERLSRAAVRCPDLDLTVFFLGDAARCVHRSGNVRHVLLPPVLGTHRFPFFREIPTHTDVAPFHPGLYGRLRGFHILHTTDAFHSFAATAQWRSRMSDIPLTTSVQTDIIGWAQVYTPYVLKRILPFPALSRWLVEESSFLQKLQRSMEGRMAKHFKQCGAVFLSNARDEERARRLAPQARRCHLRRGIDLEAFNPAKRDRRGIAGRFDIPNDRRILLFVGRVDPVKGALVAARAVKRLVEEGREVHLLVVGDGSQRKEVGELLGDRATLTGNLPHEELGEIYAGSDMLVFPSDGEVWPNVVMEAMASGLPVLVCRGSAEHLAGGLEEHGIALSGRDPEEWAQAVASLLDRPKALEKMGMAARAAARAHGITWRDVLLQDLLPVWRSLQSTRP